MKFNLVAVGGTFDHLHQGHEKILTSARALGRKMIVGLCRPAMLKNKAYLYALESYNIRQKAVRKFKPDKILPLTDIYGPAATDPAIGAIVCSPLSRPNAQTINRRRQLHRLPPLKIIEVKLVKDSTGQRLASSRIRQGLVDRQGFYYPQLFKRNLKLPENLRSQLQQPFAPVIKKITREKFGIIAVGDIAAVALLNQKIDPDLAIVDLKTKRRPVFANLAAEGLKPGLTAKNPAGTISQNAVKKLLDCFKQKQPTLLIDGEEDLLVLPAILLAPLKTTIYYGQPDQGLVKIKVSEVTKAKALSLLRRFISPKSNPKRF
jgi:hypothetical protein